MKFHVKGDVDNYSKKEIDDILEGVAEMLDCEKRDILVNGVLPSMSFIIVLSINEAYIWRLNFLSKQDCNKLRRLNIDYLIVDKYLFFFESPKGKMVNYFIKHCFFFKKTSGNSEFNLLFLEHSYLHIMKNILNAQKGSLVYNKRMTYRGDRLPGKNHF